MNLFLPYNIKLCFVWYLETHDLTYNKYQNMIYSIHKEKERQSLYSLMIMIVM